jgi:uridine kinase
MNKVIVDITIAGRPKSGKTTIMKEIVALLQSLNIEVEPEWGRDGEPRSKSESTISKQREAIAAGTKVVVNLKQSPRIKCG